MIIYCYWDDTCSIKALCCSSTYCWHFARHKRSMSLLPPWIASHVIWSTLYATSLISSYFFIIWLLVSWRIHGSKLLGTRHSHEFDEDAKGYGGLKEGKFVTTNDSPASFSATLLALLFLFTIFNLASLRELVLDIELLSRDSVRGESIVPHNMALALMHFTTTEEVPHDLLMMARATVSMTCWPN